MKNLFIYIYFNFTFLFYLKQFELCFFFFLSTLSCAQFKIGQFPANWYDPPPPKKMWVLSLILNSSSW